MADFKVIETQEDFDKAIKDRLERKEKEVAEKYKDYVAPDKASAMKAEYDSGDHLHPSKLGYKVMAQAVLKEIIE